ncbi:uncharacterized protein LOC129773719 [Toxorhynchites rutilus septentrionalis]|uniref:uncharacterized protein LOC129773719 n=1 Tax=Toxorhynchites rutilus septentrionalis TaxID=329112 RepID=UPI00247A7FCA|nr:uncharacterized protein LOC129773719 [Toxorhynchites rutilus septentrionalis]
MEDSEGAGMFVTTRRSANYLWMEELQQRKPLVRQTCLWIQQQHQQNAHAVNPSQPAPHQQQQPPFVLSPPQHQQQQIPIPADNLLTQMIHMMQQQQLQYQQQSNQFLVRQQQNEQRSEEWQQAFLRSITSSINVQVPPNPEQILDSLAGNIKEFHYEAESNLTFACWYSRYDVLFEKNASRLDDEAKVRLLLRKMGTVEHERYVSYILPRLPKDFNFAQTVEQLKGLFGAKESVISRRYRCLQVSKNPTEDHIAFACRVNKSCVQFELGKLTEEEFKCLIYVCGLKSETDAELRTRLLSKIEERDIVTLEQLSEESQRLVNLRHDNAMIESASHFDQINAVKQKFDGRRSRKRENLAIRTDTSDRKSKPKSPYRTPGRTWYQCEEVVRICKETEEVLGNQQSGPMLAPATVKAKTASGNVLPLDAVNQELDRLEKINIISPVDYSEWAAPIVVVRKANGSIRIRGNYSTALNAALQPHQYPLPRPEDIFAKLVNCKVFSQIDLSDTFLQVEVNEASRGMLTINTHRGLFQYNRLPPGVKIAPGEFQQLIDTVLAGLEGTSGYMDDVVGGGKSDQEHDCNLKAVLQRIEGSLAHHCKVCQCVLLQ